MRAFESCSGPWAGRWRQVGAHLSGAMRFHLNIVGGAISGQGSDSGGKFIIIGGHDGATEEVWVLKQYDSLNVRYQGTWDGAMVSGNSRIWSWSPPFLDHGEFEMWPEGDEEELRLEQVIEIEAPVPVGASMSQLSRP